MKYGSVCSGVEAATVAWHGLGWEPQWFSEIDKFPSAVLAHHYPNVPNLGDMSKFKEWNDDPIDLLVGGTPCQSFSVAGLRKGLDDPRGNLMLTYVAIAARYKPRWLVWENVPGVLSSNRGRDFGTLLAALGKIGYGFAYRVLDAQYFGVAQRRRRVFVVGYLGDWRRAAAVLFERESLSGHPAPSRKEKQETAGYTASSFGKYDQGVGTIRAAGGDLGGGSETLVAKCLTTRVGRAFDALTEQFVTEQRDVNTITASYGMGGVDWETKPLLYGNKKKIISHAIHPHSIGRSEKAGPQGRDHLDAEKAYTHDARGTAQVVANANAVRRLTPIETERLQGFPDNYTQIPWRNKTPENCPDGPRYKAMGNSMAVPVMRWIGERIQMVEEITQ